MYYTVSVCSQSEIYEGERDCLCIPENWNCYSVVGTSHMSNESASPSWCQAPIWDPRPIFLSPWDFLLDSYWREDGSVIYCSCWSSPAQSR
jgi:hypothetical protein